MFLSSQLRHHRLLALAHGFTLILGGMVLYFGAVYMLRQISVDRWIDGYKQVWRLQATITPPNSSHMRLAGAPAAAVPYVASVARAGEAVTGVTLRPFTVIAEGAEHSLQIASVDKEFFRVFKVPGLIPPGGFLKPGEIILTATAEVRLFGNRSSLPRTVVIPAVGAFTVVRVVEDWPENSHFRADAFIQRDPKEQEEAHHVRDWMSVGDYVYVRSDSGSDLQRRIVSKFDDYMLPMQGGRAGLKPSGFIQLTLVRVDRIAFSGGLQGSVKPSASWDQVLRISILVALLCISLMAVHIATVFLLSHGGRTEIAMLQLAGIGPSKLRRAVAWQSVVLFLAPSITGAGIGWSISEFGVNDIVPVVAVQIPIGIALVASVVAAALIVISGVASTGRLSAMGISSVLRGSKSSSTTSVLKMDVAVAGMTCLSTVVICLSVAVLRQYLLFQWTDTGIKLSATYIVRDAHLHHGFGQRTAIKEEFRGAGGGSVKAVGFLNDLPGEGATAAVGVVVPGSAQNAPVTLEYVAADANVLNMLGSIPVVGTLTEGYAQAAEQAQALRTGDPVLINESATKALGFAMSADAVGKHILVFGEGEPAQVRVVAVMADVRWRGLFNAPTPMIFVNDGAAFRHVVVRMDEGSHAMESVSKGAAAAFPGAATRVQALNHIWDRQFDAVNASTRLVLLFSIVCVVCVVVGLSMVARANLRATELESTIRRLFGQSPVSVAGQVLRRMWVASGIGLVAGALLGLGSAPMMLVEISRADWNALPDLTIAIAGTLSICGALMLWQSFEVRLLSPQTLLKNST